MDLPFAVTTFYCSVTPAHHSPLTSPRRIILFNGSKNRISWPAMQLSVLIVNFNVKHFLEQCLCSVKVAMKDIEGEVIVVDNNSSDDSIDYLKARFSWVKFIHNSTNVGFAKANNQALQQAKGSHILFLNPDTLVPENCLVDCLDFLEQQPKAGALGVRMIDGSGRFLRESKRAFPSPLTSLFKLLGLSAMLPSSSIFSRYHLGHLSPSGNHEVDVLAGAFMLVKKAVLEEVGCFDESFFMYGEDVDLSYRIQKAGWKNYYFAGAEIIHFKGESTKKGSLNYVRMFYQAMNQFVHKHYSSGKAGFFKIFIQLAIWLRATVSAFGRFLKWMGLPLADILITLGCFAIVAWFWEHIVKPGIEYRPEVMLVVLPLFTAAFIMTGGIAGLYDRWYRPARAWIAMIAAIIFSLAVYSLLDINYRFSRGVILFGGVLASLAILLFRKILVNANMLVDADEQNEFRQTLIAGNADEYESAVLLMQLAGRNERVLGRVGLIENEPHTSGSFSQMGQLLNIVPAREIVFCINEQLSLAKAMAFMQKEKRNIRYKFFYKNSGSIVGSDSKETSGEALSGSENFAIENPENRRMKKISDIAWCLLLLLLYPVNLFLVKKPLLLLRNIVLVLIAKKTWVGYSTPSNKLPVILPGIIGTNAQAVNQQRLNYESLEAIDYWYAKDYEWLTDSRLIVKAYRHLGGY